MSGVIEFAAAAGLSPTARWVFVIVHEIAPADRDFFARPAEVEELSGFSARTVHDILRFLEGRALIIRDGRDRRARRGLGAVRGWRAVAFGPDAEAVAARAPGVGEGLEWATAPAIEV